MVKSLAESTCQMWQDQQRFEQETRAGMRSLEAQISQLASSMSNFENSKRKLPSQVIPNPKENASAMLLRNGKEIHPTKPEATRNGKEQVTEEPEQEEVSTPPRIPKTSDINPPFPGRFTKAKKEESEKEILDTFRKIEINIPLLEAIRQLPKYARFLKELCTNRKKLNFQDKVRVGENVSAVLQKKLPQKCKDQSMFTIPCIIGQKRIERGMLDLGASINVMPLSIFKALNLGSLKETGVVIQLADRSNVYSEDVVEDVLVKVNEFIFPADFYIVDMNDDNLVSSAVLLLGRPFMSTDFLEQNLMEDKLEFVLQHSKTTTDVESKDEEKILEAIMSLHSLPTPELELKELPKHLKYAYLEDHNTLPVIIANDLTEMQQEKLLRVLRETKPAIGWMLADIKGINLSVCMHHILLELEAKSVRE
ncbi:uncharacterized protein LOC113766452 [Coffea eugenioides]|uniref:uncharacterized protein LOC113766452 n=1 Tax=Coffea eugenioides TaxID=49369 RepID=UPI000F6050A8|nr:uncharacterized protein LOC113766452 [Coffea eugenioides]